MSPPRDLRNLFGEDDESYDDLPSLDKVDFSYHKEAGKDVVTVVFYPSKQLASETMHWHPGFSKMFALDCCEKVVKSPGLMSKYGTKRKVIEKSFNCCNNNTIE